MPKYYRILLVDTVTYLEGSPSWERYETLKLAGHGVEVLDPALHPGLVGPGGEKNESMVAALVENFNPDYIAWGDETAEQILDELADTELGQDEPPRHFVVFGYVGKDNFGDELIFRIIRREIQARYAGSYVTLIGHDPEASLARQGVVSVTPLMKDRINMMLNGASALVFMAGIMFDEPFVKWTSGVIDLFQNPHSELAGQTAMALLAYANDVPAVYLGIGAGPLAEPDSRVMVRMAALTRPTFIARDTRTVALLMAAGVDKKLISHEADLAFLVRRQGVGEKLAARLEDWGVEPKELVTVALRRCEGLPEGFVANVAALLDAAHEWYGLRAVFMDFAPEDAEIHDAVIAAMKHGDSTLRFGSTYDMDETLQMLGHCRFTVAMRLHCSLVANVNKVPSIGFDYSDKVAELYRLMGRSKYLLPLDFEAKDAEQLIDSLLARYPVEVAALVPRVSAMRKRAERAFRKLWSIVDAHAPEPRPQRLYSRVESVADLQLKGVIARTDRTATEASDAADTLQAENDALRMELDAVKESTTWKAGSWLTAIPRRIKDAFAH